MATSDDSQMDLGHNIAAGEPVATERDDNNNNVSSGFAFVFIAEKSQLSPCTSSEGHISKTQETLAERLGVAKIVYRIYH